MPMPDQRFGANLSSAQPAQGVLPAPDTGTSASEMPQYADGGAIDTTQDSGDAAPPNSDPFAMISQALTQGRKKFGLPENFFQDAASGLRKGFSAADASLKKDTDTMTGQTPAAPPPDGQFDDTQSFAEGGTVEDDTADQGVIPDGGETPQDQGEQPQATPNGNAQGAMAYLKGTGAVGPEIAAALEQQVDPQGQMPPSMRKAMAIASAGDPDKAFQVMQHYRQKFNAYGAFAKAALQGSGGRPPNPAAAADALNKAYDHVPDGKELKFSPTQGGMRVSIGGGQQAQPQAQQQEPEPQQFEEGGEVQADWRTRLRDTIGLAKYGPQGTGPAPEQEDPEAAVYARSPQGPQRTAQFPGQSPSDQIPAGYARDPAVISEENSRGVSAAQFLSGASTQEDLADPEVQRRMKSLDTAGGVISDLASKAVNSQNMRPVTRPLNAVKDFMLSIPALLGWTSKDGQFDAAINKPVDQTLAQASQQQPMPPSQGGITSQGMTSQANLNPMAGYQTSEQPQPQPSGAPVSTGGPGYQPRETPRNAEQFGAQVGTRLGEEGFTLADVLHEIDQAYHFVGQAKDRALARAAARQHWADNHVKIAAEQTKSDRAENVARIAGGSREKVADTNVGGRIAATNIQQTHGDTRAANKFQTQRDIAGANRDATMERTKFVQSNLNDRNDVTQKPGLVGNKDKIEASRVARGAPPGGPQAPQPQQQQSQAPAAKPAARAAPVSNQQPSQSDIAYLLANPGAAAKFDARFGAGASQRVLGQ